MLVNLLRVFFFLSASDFCLLMGSPRYDFFKAELLKTTYFDDNILCHFTASFAAVRLHFILYALRHTVPFETRHNLTTNVLFRGQ